MAAGPFEKENWHRLNEIATALQPGGRFEGRFPLTFFDFKGEKSSEFHDVILTKTTRSQVDGTYEFGKGTTKTFSFQGISAVPKSAVAF